MAMTIEKANELLDVHSALITNSADSWQTFLGQACKFSNYSFTNQIMICSQRTSPTAVASYQYWNDKQDCAVIAGRKGIAIFTESHQLRYVFDAADVRAIHERGGHKPNLWKYEARHEELLRSVIDQTDKSVSLVPSIKKSIEEFFSSNLASLNLSKEFSDFIIDSSFYTIASRLGLSVPKELVPSFDKVPRYREVLPFLGSSIQRISKIYLSDIGEKINAFEKERSERVLDEREAPSLEKENQEKKNEEIANESREQYQVREGRGLLLSGDDSRSGREASSEAVRTDENRLSERESSGGSRAEDEPGNLLQGNSGIAEDGLSERSRTDGGASERLSGDDRGNEGEGTSSMDSTPIRIESIREEPDSRGDALQLTFRGEFESENFEQLSLFAPLEMEQLGGIMIRGSHFKERMPHDFQLSEENLNDILRSGTNDPDSREDIWHQYCIQKSPEEMTSYLQEQYKFCGKGFN